MKTKSQSRPLSCRNCKTFFKVLDNLKECRITPKEGAELKAIRARRIPIALQDGFKKELDIMEKLSIIKKVSYPIDWVNAAVVVKKRDKASGMHLHDLNMAVKRPHYPIPTYYDTILKHSDVNSSKNWMPAMDTVFTPLMRISINNVQHTIW